MELECDSEYSPIAIGATRATLSDSEICCCPRCGQRRWEKCAERPATWTCRW